MISFRAHKLPGPLTPVCDWLGSASLFHFLSLGISGIYAVTNTSRFWDLLSGFTGVCVSIRFLEGKVSAHSSFYWTAIHFLKNIMKSTAIESAAQPH